MGDPKPDSASDDVSGFGQKTKKGPEGGVPFGSLGVPTGRLAGRRYFLTFTFLPTTFLVMNFAYFLAIFLL